MVRFITTIYKLLFQIQMKNSLYYGNPVFHLFYLFTNLHKQKNKKLEAFVIQYFLTLMICLMKIKPLFEVVKKRF